MKGAARVEEVAASPHLPRASWMMLLWHASSLRSPRRRARGFLVRSQRFRFHRTAASSRLLLPCMDKTLSADVSRRRRFLDATKNQIEGRRLDESHTSSRQESSAFRRNDATWPIGSSRPSSYIRIAWRSAAANLQTFARCPMHAQTRKAYATTTVDRMKRNGALWK